MRNNKTFDYSDSDMENIYGGINDLFALEALSEDEEEDLDDYDPEEDSDEGIDDDDDDDGYDAEIDGDSDPAEDEDDEYDDVVENVGINNLDEVLDIDSLLAEDIMKARATESAIDELMNDYRMDRALEGSVDIALTKSVLDDEHSSKFNDDIDALYGLDFDDDDEKGEDLFDAEYFND
jgi:hypothetical protein